MAKSESRLCRVAKSEPRLCEVLYRTDLFAVEVCVPLKGSSGASEGEHWQRYRNGNIDSNLTHIDLGLELPSNSTGSGENCSSIPIRIGIDDVYGLKWVHV